MILESTDPAGVLRQLARAIGHSEDSYRRADTQKDKRFHAGRQSGLKSALEMVDVMIRSQAAGCGVEARTATEVLCELVDLEWHPPTAGQTIAELTPEALPKYKVEARCADCGAEARSTKNGPPAVIRHKPDCATDLAWVREHTIDPIADRIATEYGASSVRPPDGANDTWQIEGLADDHGRPAATCRLRFYRDGRFLGAWDPDNMYEILRNEGLLPAASAVDAQAAGRHKRNAAARARGEDLNG